MDTHNWQPPADDRRPATSDSPPAIEFRHVSLSLDDKLVLDDLCFVLPRGQTLFIIGAPGSGKTLLLRMALGLEQPDAGEVFIEGRELDCLRRRDLLKLRHDVMGMVYQEPTLFTMRSVFDNIAYRLDEHGWDAAAIERAVGEALRFVGLDADRDKWPEALSVAMRRRLEVARALAGWPPVMLFDEATAGLDPVSAHQVMDIVIRAGDLHHVSVLYVTKALHEIAYFTRNAALTGEAGVVEPRAGRCRDAAAQKIIVLDAGRIAFIGTAAELAASQLPAVKQLRRPPSRHTASHRSQGERR